MGAQLINCRPFLACSYLFQQLQKTLVLLRSNNQWPKGDTLALLCINMNLSERKQGSGPKGDKVCRTQTRFFDQKGFFLYLRNQNNLLTILKQLQDKSGTTVAQLGQFLDKSHIDKQSYSIRLIPKRVIISELYYNILSLGQSG